MEDKKLIEDLKQLVAFADSLKSHANKILGDLDVDDKKKRVGDVDLRVAKALARREKNRYQQK